jgi:hypothetical protein
MELVCMVSDYLAADAPGCITLNFTVEALGWTMMLNRRFLSLPVIHSQKQ